MSIPTEASDAPIPEPLWLILRTNSLQLWRKFRALGEQSRLLSAVILVFLAGYLSVSFWLFYRGLEFLERFPGLGTLLTERLLFLLFAFLFGLLLLSNLIICYSNLFRNRETQFLMTLPVSAQTIFRWKFIESILLASWAFIFLIAPLLAAFGMTRAVPWHFYPITCVLVLLFIILPGVGGSWLALNLARYMERRSFQVVTLSLAVIALVALAVVFRPEPTPEEMQETRVMSMLDRLLQKTRFAQFPLLPSYWLSNSVLNWTEGIFASAGFFILVLLSYALFFGMLAMTRLGGLFTESASRVWSRESIFSHWAWFRKRAARGLLHQPRKSWLEWLLFRLEMPPEKVALVMKDARMFWRDTTQWGQSLMLFGLLGVYIINLRHFTQQLSNPFWVHLVSYLNLGACSLNLATVTTRFVYPQFSLEGKRVWIVGMSPMGLRAVVMTKFWTASLSSLVVTLVLIWLSCTMLEMPHERIAYFLVATTIMTFSLNALAVGLGVLYPNFKEENPSKIVSGFGGTFCLVLSFLYILCSVAILAFGSPWRGVARVSYWEINLCWGGFLAFSIAIAAVPFWIALKRLRTFEI